MKYTIDTKSKTITIAEGTTEEVIELCKQYKGFNLITDMTFNVYPVYPIYPTLPYCPEPYINPYLITCDGTIDNTLTLKQDYEFTNTH